MKRITALIISWCMLCVATAPGYASQIANIERWQTKQGTPVVFYQAMDIPMLNISLAFRAGSSFDGQLFGLSTLTARLLNQGNGGQDANTIANQLANTGAQFSSESNRDMIVMSLRTLTDPKALEPATALFTQIVKQPDFPEKAFLREKKQQIMGIKHALESPDQVANQTFFRALYQSHPYAHPVDGDIKTVERISREDVVHFHKKYFASGNAIIVLVGALDKKEAMALAEKISNSLLKGPKAPNIAEAKILKEALDIEVPFPSTQTMLRLGQLGINHHNPQYFPLMVGNYTLGGGALVSRLATELREKRGLTYGVYSQFLPMPERGPFIISFSTKASQAKDAEKLTRDTLKAFIQKGPSEDELKAAKQYLVGSFPLSIASNHSMASILLKMAFYNLPDNYLDTYTQNIENVDIAEIQSAFRRHINPDHLLQVMVGKT